MSRKWNTRKILSFRKWNVCVWNFGRAHGLKNRKSNASFLTNTFIWLYVQSHMCKGVPRNHTSMYNKEESLFTSTGRVQYYKFVRILNILILFEIIFVLSNWKVLAWQGHLCCSFFETSYISFQIREKYFRQI